MTVGLSCQVVRGWSVTQMSVDHDTEALELVEVPVDRGQVDVGGELLNGLGQVLRRAVGTTFEELLKQEPARGGYPTTSGSQQVQNLLDAVGP
jgi:hypothetical protein